MRSAFRLAGPLAPSALANLAHRIYFSPRRRRVSSRDRQWLVGSDQEWIETKSGEVAAYVWPYGGLFPWEGPRDRGTVLLVHGWEGRGAQLGAFVEPLRAAGYRVIAFDAPAHGKSPGEQTNLLEFADAISTIADRYGPIDAVIAHSMGVPSVGLALASGLEVGRTVFIGGPSRFASATKRFVTELGLTPEIEHRFRRRIEARFGEDVWDRFDAAALAGEDSPPALVVHDVDDPIVHFSEAEHLAEVWPGARLVATAGLGHQRVLRDPMVIEEAVRFVEGAPRRPLALAQGAAETPTR